MRTQIKQRLYFENLVLGIDVNHGYAFCTTNTRYETLLSWTSHFYKILMWGDEERKYYETVSGS
jgi:hypothetical protein